MKEYQLRGTGYRIRYFDFHAEKTPILFIHGLGCAGSFDYVDVAYQDTLSGHRKIVVDLLGAGYSDKPTDFVYSVKAHAKYLSEFIEDLRLEKVIVYGHSLGGAIAIELCTLCNEKVEKLILNEANLEPSKEGDASWEIARLNRDNLEKELSQKIKTYEAKGNTMWTSSFKQWLPKAAYELSIDAVNGGMPSWKRTVLGLKIPKFFIYGSKSLPDQDYAELKGSNEEVKLVENAGHSMAWESPVQLSYVIQECLQSKLSEPN